MSTYDSFVESKIKTHVATGHSPISSMDFLFDFQLAIVKFALKKGRAAIFADTGLGKTAMLLAWANDVSIHTGKPVLVLAPLAVSEQTIREGAKFKILVTRVNPSVKIENGVWITNYERIDNLDFSQFSGLVLDESSILKSFEGKIRTLIIDKSQCIPYRLSCTATPSPNDFTELGNQCEFLGVMSRNEMLATYFVNDTGDTGTWVLKNWGKTKFWEWIATWAVVIRNPSDLGFDGSAYTLPDIVWHNHVIAAKSCDGDLFPMPAQSLTDRRSAKRESIGERCQMVADLCMSEPEEPWLVWCKLNDEGKMLAQMIVDGVNVEGSDKPDKKTQSMMDFSDGKLRVLISKPKICGFGMNWQHCARVVFASIDDSFEQFYQAIRRSWRYPQKRNVHVHIVLSEKELSILDNLKEKQSRHDEMSVKMINHMKDAMQKEVFESSKVSIPYEEATVAGDKYTMHHGDCVKWLERMPSDHVDYCVFSPPFSDLFVYSNSEFDMGNCFDDSQFFCQLGFMAKELFRVLKTGRNCSFHCMNLPTKKSVDGYIGLKDFRGELIRVFQDQGFIYHAEVCIKKDPVVQMQRTKALGLLHKTVLSNSTMCRMGLADYVVTMRKPGKPEFPVVHDRDDFPVDMWQKYANPVWDDIDQGRTLNKMPARDENDEKHMCPLQLDVVERCVHMWTNKNDLVLSPFAGIGSEGHGALRLGRRFVGIELKNTYFDLAVENLNSTVNANDLFD